MPTFTQLFTRVRVRIQRRKTSSVRPLGAASTTSRAVNTPRGSIAVFSASLLCASLAHAVTDVNLIVERTGLKYKADCTGDVFRIEPDADPNERLMKLDDLTRPFTVHDGRYHVVITCPSTEGPLKQSLEFNGKGRPLTIPVSMAPAFLVTTVMREESEVPADVTVYDERNRIVAKTRHKVVSPVPVGKLMVRARVDKSVSGKKKTILGEIEAKTTDGKKTAVSIDTSDGILELTLTSNRKPVNGVGVLRIPGTLDRIADVTAGEGSSVPPGTYDVVTQLYESHDFHEIVTQKVTIQSKKTSKMKVEHPTGVLDIAIIKDKTPFPDDKKVEIDLYLGAAPKPFNTILRGENASLAPGTFRARARVLGETWDDGSPVEGEVEVKIKGGAVTKATIDLTPSRFDVTTSVGGTPRALDVHVFVPGATAPLARKTTDKDGKVSFTLPGGRLLVKTILTAPQGELIVEKPIVLAAGKPSSLAVDLDVGSARVQVFERAIAVAAEVIFTKEGEPEPTLTLPAGREAFLPPATYLIAVRRRGVVRSYAPIKIASGRVVERQLDLAQPDPVTEPKKPAMPEGDAAKGDAKAVADATKEAAADAKAAKDAKDASGKRGAKKGSGEPLPEGDDDDILAD